MITNTIQDPENLKTNNEIAKAQLKKRFEKSEPGPGTYNPDKLTKNGLSFKAVNLEDQ